MLNRTIAIDDRFNSLTPMHQWLYMRLLPFQDDYGRMTGKITELRLQTLPNINFTDEVLCQLLNDIAVTGLISWKPGVVIQYWGTDKNNKFDHRKANSLYPDIKQLTGKGQERLELVSNGSSNISNITKITNKEATEDFYKKSEKGKTGMVVHIRDILKKQWGTGKDNK